MPPSYARSSSAGSRPAGRHGRFVCLADAGRSRTSTLSVPAMAEQLAALRLAERDTGLRFAQARFASSRAVANAHGRRGRSRAAADRAPVLR